MSKAILDVRDAMARARDLLAAGGGFPHLAEALRLAGVRRNEWHLPSCQSVYVTDEGSIVNQGAPLLDGFADVAAFNEEALVAALRIDRAGESTFDEFLAAIWDAGVVHYVVDLDARTCAYYGWSGECYREHYPAVSLPE